MSSKSDIRSYWSNNSVHIFYPFYSKSKRGIKIVLLSNQAQPKTQNTTFKIEKLPSVAEIPRPLRGTRQIPCLLFQNIFAICLLFRTCFKTARGYINVSASNVLKSRTNKYQRSNEWSLSYNQGPETFLINYISIISTSAKFFWVLAPTDPVYYIQKA